MSTAASSACDSSPAPCWRPRAITVPRQRCHSGVSVQNVCGRSAPGWRHKLPALSPGRMASARAVSNGPEPVLPTQVVLIGVRQVGQLGRCRTQVSAQAAQNRCRHGNAFSCAPMTNSDRQIGHWSSPSCFVSYWTVAKLPRSLSVARVLGRHVRRSTVIGRDIGDDDRDRVRAFSRSTRYRGARPRDSGWNTMTLSPVVSRTAFVAALRSRALTLHGRARGSRGIVVCVWPGTGATVSPLNVSDGS